MSRYNRNRRKARKLHDEAVLAFWVSGDPSRCLQLIKKAIATDPTFPEAFALLGEIKAKLGDDQSAIKAYLKAKSLGFRKPALYYNLGNALMRNREFPSAIQEFSSAIELDPTVESYVNRAWCYFDLGDYAKAVEDVIEGLCYGPGDTKGVDLFLQAVEHLPPTDQLDYYEDAITWAGENRRLLNSFGVKLIAAKKRERATEVFAQLGELAPEDSQPWSNLASIYSEAGDNEKALTLMERALKIEPENSDLLFNLGVIKYRSGRVPEALQDFASAVDKCPGDYQARRWLALCHLIAGDPTTGYNHFLTTCSGPSEIPFDSAFVIELINTFWWSGMPDLGEMILAQIELEFCRNDWASLKKVLNPIRSLIFDASIEDLTNKLRPRDHIAILCCRALELVASNSVNMKEAVRYLSLLHSLPTSISVILSASEFRKNINLDSTFPENSLLVVGGLPSWLLLNAGVGVHSLDLKNKVVFNMSLKPDPALQCLKAYEVARQRLAVSELDQGRAILMDVTFSQATDTFEEKSSRRLRTLESLFHEGLSRPPIVRPRHNVSEKSLETDHSPREIDESADRELFEESSQIDSLPSHSERLISSIRADWPVGELYFGPDENAFEGAPYFKTIENLSKDLNQPLIYIASSRWTGVANVVYAEKITTIDLPELHTQNLEREIGDYLAAQQSLLLSPSIGSLSRMQEKVDDLTKWLWTSVMEPIVHLLKKQGNQKAILVSGGLLGLLPLSAAQHIDADGCRRYALDEIVFTSIPTARMAERIRMRMQPLTTDSQFLGIVGDEEEPITSEWSKEVKRGASKFSRSAIIYGRKASIESILDQISKADIVHICGHGDASADQLMRGRLYFGESGKDYIGAKDLLEIGSLHARLMILSACQVGLQSKILPDECLSLPTMLLRAGANGVIAPLWPVENSCTSILLTKMYDFLFQDAQYGDPIQALTDTQRWMRSSSDFRVEPLTIMRGTGHDFIWDNSSQDVFIDWQMNHPFYWAGFTYFGF